MYAIEIVLIAKKGLVDINNLVIFHENIYHVLGFTNINAFMHQLPQRKPVTAKCTLYTCVPCPCSHHSLKSMSVQDLTIHSTLS